MGYQQEAGLREQVADANICIATLEAALAEAREDLARLRTAAEKLLDGLEAQRPVQPQCMLVKFARKNLRAAIDAARGRT
jgi:hypothetical protein